LNLALQMVPGNFLKIMRLILYYIYNGAKVI